MTKRKRAYCDLFGSYVWMQKTGRKNLRKAQKRVYKGGFNIHRFVIK